MREIKFRAWYVGELIYRGIHDRNWYTDPNGGVCTKGTHPSDQNTMELMQYTGLLDKNGVEIYEGDVLKGKYWDEGPHRFIGQVIFTCSAWYVQGVKKYTRYQELNKFKDCEVIGNIHENPELLATEPTAADLDCSWPSRGVDS